MFGISAIVWDFSNDLGFRQWFQVWDFGISFGCYMSKAEMFRLKANEFRHLSLLQYFPVSEFIFGSHGIDIENLWREFYRLYKILRKSSHTEEEILEFEKDAKNWI